MSIPWFGYPAFGTGVLGTETSGYPDVSTVYTLAGVFLGQVHQVLWDNAPGAKIYGGSPNGHYVVTEYQPDATIAFSYGNEFIRDFGGSATITGSSPYGGEGGYDRYVVINATTLNLGSGINHVFLGGSRNTINMSDSGGVDHVRGAIHGSETFTVGSAGGFLTVRGFTLTNGDVLDLSRMSVNDSDVHLSTQGSGRYANTVLTINGPSGGAHVTLLHTGPITLSQLEQHSLIL
ncbi:MAG TPA: hypothetical protein VJY39_00480 [Acidisphaera sp.]|nr:hypothetical protein [Acidisphaera sp.]